MTNELAIEINHEVQDLLHSRGLRDPDQFGLRLSRALARHLQMSKRPEAAFADALSETRTIFFRTNGESRDEFQGLILRRLEERDVIGRTGLDDALRGFVRFAERQLADELWKSRADEGVLRSHMQSFLEGRIGRTLKEMATGRGRTDIALLDEQTKEIVEAKLWKGKEYYQDGLAELAEYLRTEGLTEGHYVVLDCSVRNEFLDDKERDWTEHVGGRMIHVFFIRVSSASPSKLRRSQRRAGL